MRVKGEIQVKGHSKIPKLQAKETPEPSAEPLLKSSEPNRTTKQNHFGLSEGEEVWPTLVLAKSA